MAWRLPAPGTRASALVPAALFAAIAAQKLTHGAAVELLWGCFVSLVLQVGALTLQKPAAIRAAALLNVVAFGFWLIGLSLGEQSSALSWAVHGLGVTFSVLLLHRCGRPGATWWSIPPLIIALQIAGRFADPALNLNCGWGFAPGAPHLPSPWLEIVAVEVLATVLGWGGERLIGQAEPRLGQAPAS